MYLISAYFDAKTEKTIQSLINKVAEVTGNTFMLDGKIPPHITLSAFEARDEKLVIELFENNMDKFVGSSLFLATIGMMKSQVIYAEPVLNEYLFELSRNIFEIYKDIPDIRFSPYYKPFEWIPHLSIGKHLDEAQIVKAFEVMLKCFVPMECTVSRIGIAKTNPHRDIKVYEL